MTRLHFQILSLKIVTNLELLFDRERTEDVFRGSFQAVGGDRVKVIVSQIGFTQLTKSPKNCVPRLAGSIWKLIGRSVVSIQCSLIQASAAAAVCIAIYSPTFPHNFECLVCLGHSNLSKRQHKCYTLTVQICARRVRA